MQSNEQFTHRARKVLALANDEALRFGHEAIDSEHLLLGIVREGTGVGAVVLRARGVDLNVARDRVARVIRMMRIDVMPTRLPTTPSVRRILDLAREEAQRMGQSAVGTEHLLVGLLCDSDSVAAHVLRDLGINLETTRRDISEALSRPDAKKDDSADSRFSPLFDTIAVSATSISPRVQRVMEEAQVHARRLGHSEVGTEHLLIPVLLDPQCGAVHAIEKLRVDPARLVQALEHSSVRPAVDQPEGTLPFTTLARRAIRAACDEAYSLNHVAVETEHLVLGVLHEPAGVGAEVLGGYGVRIVDFRAQVTRMRDARSAPEPTAQPAGPPPLTTHDFTERVLDALRRARTEVRENGRFQVDLPDLVMAILTQPNGLGARFLPQFMDNLLSQMRNLLAEPIARK